MDLKKAYETINREILLKKLPFYGIRGLPLELISDYLSCRTQVVKIGNQVSDRRKLLTGLPTGSVLSCILFLLYVNDLPNISDQITPILFADDTTLSFSGSNMENVTSKCNSELEKFLVWTQANRLCINTEKSFKIVISKRLFDQTNIYLNNALIENKRFGRFLGVTIDQNMNFKIHIDEMCKKISKSIGIIHHLKNYLSTTSLISLYYCLVYPYLTYCSLVWAVLMSRI